MSRHIVNVVLELDDRLQKIIHRTRALPNRAVDPTPFTHGILRSSRACIHVKILTCVHTHKGGRDGGREAGKGGYKIKIKQ